MDDSTRSILEQIKEQEEHPERFSYKMICDNCGREHTEITSKEEIQKYKNQHPECTGIPELHTWECEKCSAKEEDDD